MCRGVVQSGVSDVRLAQQRLPALVIDGRVYWSAEVVEGMAVSAFGGAQIRKSRTW